MENNVNLFLNLNRWAIRQNENFTTEGLVYLLNHLLICNPPLACYFLKKMTNDFLDINDQKTGSVKIKTQTIIDEGKPDIEIIFFDYLIYIEVKIDSDLGPDQLARYRQALNQQENKKTLLVLLSRYPFEIDNNGSPNVAIRWYQIADWIRVILKMPNITNVTIFLLNEFLGFLRAQHLILSRVRSPISEGLNSYRINYCDIAESLGRMRSFDKLDSNEDLKPLSDLLKLMKEAFSGFPIKPRLESGKHKGGWVGYVFDHVDSFFCIYYSQPEIVVFETFNFNIVLDKFDGITGKIWREGNKVRWKNELDLFEIKYFEMDINSQLIIIKSFLKHSYEYSRSLGTSD